MRDDLSFSIYPIIRRQWDALQTIASRRGGTRADLLRDAIGRLLDDRDAGELVTYTAAPKLSAEEKSDTKPRIVWLKSPLSERMRDRCATDRISQSDLILEAVRRYLKAENVTIEPSI